VWLALPFYDFCGFRSVAVNSVYKLQFFTFIKMINAIKYHSDDLLNFYAIYEAQNVNYAKNVRNMIW